MPKPIRPWTEEEIERCKRLYFDEHINRKEMAIILNRSVHDCHSMMLRFYREQKEVKREIIYSKLKRSETDIIIRDLVSQGWSPKWIANKLNVPVATIETLLSSGARGTINLGARSNETQELIGS